MDYFKPFSADTQAAFFSAEAEMIRFGERAAQLPYAEYLKNTMLAIDAVFAIRMTHDVALSPVPLIVLFDVAGWKFDNDVDHCLAMMRSIVRLPEEASGAAIEALHYMQALEWISRISKPGFAASPETTCGSTKSCFTASAPRNVAMVSVKPTCHTRRGRFRLRFPVRSRSCATSATASTSRPWGRRR